MHDRQRHDRMNSDDTRLASALRSLPLLAPPAEVWPALAARAARRRRTRRWARVALPVAVAAAIVLAIAVPLSRHAAGPSAAAPTASASVTPLRPQPSDLDALRVRSQRLQAWVGELADQRTPLGAGALLRVTRIEDRIGLVDLQLGASSDTSTQRALWRQRVALLQRLALVRLSPSALATRGARVGRATPRPAGRID